MCPILSFIVGHVSVNQMGSGAGTAQVDGVRSLMAIVQFSPQAHLRRFLNPSPLIPIFTHESLVNMTAAVTCKLIHPQCEVWKTLSTVRTAEDHQGCMINEPAQEVVHASEATTIHTPNSNTEQSNLEVTAGRCTVESNVLARRPSGGGRSIEACR